MLVTNRRAELLDALMAKGHYYRFVDDIFEQKVLFPAEVETILEHLREFYTEDPFTANTLVRSLTAAKEPFNPFLLIDLFENGNLSASLRSGLAIVLSYAKTTNISEWLRDRLLNKPYDEANHGLILGLYRKGGFSGAEDYMNFLKKIFTKYPGDIMYKRFAKYGKAEDWTFLEETAEKVDARLRREIHKILKRRTGKILIPQIGAGKILISPMGDRESAGSAQ